MEHARRVVEFVSAQQLREIQRRAIEALTRDDDDPMFTEIASTTFLASMDALRFVASAAAAMHDPSLLDLCLSSLDAMEHLNTEAADHDEQVAEAIGAIVGACDFVPPFAEDLAGHQNAAVRIAFVKNITLDQPEGVKLLESLVNDSDLQVRQHARTRLATIRPVQWWTGKFSNDPLELLGKRPSRTVERALARLGELADLPWFKLGDEIPTLLKALSKLPDALVFDFLRMNMGDKTRKHGDWGKLLAEGLRRDGSESTLLHIAHKWLDGGEYSMYCADVLKSAAAVLEVKKRTALSLALIDAAQSEAVADQESLHGRAVELVRLGEALWDPRADLAPIVDRILGGPPPSGPEATNWARSLLRDIAKSSRTVAKSEARLTALLVAGFPNCPDEARAVLTDALEQLPPARLRAVANAATKSDVRSTIVWGHEQLAGAAHDPKRDPPSVEIACRLYESLSTRWIVDESRALSELAIPALRTAFGRGDLDVHAAALLIREIESDPAADPESVAARNAWPALTDAEWDRWRELRDANRGDKRLRLLGTLMPRGPFHPRDREMFDVLMDRMRAGDDTLPYVLAPLLGEKAALEDLPLFDEMRRHAAPIYLGTILEGETAARARLRLPSLDAEKAARVRRRKQDATGAEEMSVEWMDEPE